MPVWFLLLILAVAAMQDANGSDLQVLFTFDAAESNAWAAVNDNVMGGLSEGGLDIRDGVLRFSGNLSLENNGGFSSIRHPIGLDLSAHQGIRLRVRGDGRSYQLRLQTDSRYYGRPVAYSATFPTRAGEWLQVDVPFSDLGAGFRGRKLDGYQFDPGKIELIGILLGDKEAGPFLLEVDWLAAY